MYSVNMAINRRGTELTNALTFSAIGGLLSLARRLLAISQESCLAARLLSRPLQRLDVRTSRTLNHHDEPPLHLSDYLSAPTCRSLACQAGEKSKRHYHWRYLAHSYVSCRHFDLPTSAHQGKALVLEWTHEEMAILAGSGCEYVQNTKHD